MVSRRVAVIGAGVGGLAAAMDLALAGFEVTVFERAAAPGGKIREVQVAGRCMDAGPSVFTMRDVFDDLFADAGEHFDAHVKLTRAHILARHAWSSHERLDLHADLQESIAAIAAFAGAREAKGFEAFAAQARQVYATLRDSFIRASRPSTLGLVRRLPPSRWMELWGIQPFTTLWRSTSRYFKDPRLRQLFGRYATYCGSSPFSAPATLMLVSHVEQAGVWYIEGGMHQLALQMAAAAQRRGVNLRYSSEVSRVCVDKGRVHAVQLAGGERVPADAIVCNSDTNALASGCFGPEVMSGARVTRPSSRSLSAITWNMVARTSGFELAHHTVFFSADYRSEFDAIFRRRQLADAPSIYVCAQDRRDGSPPGTPPRSTPMGMPMPTPLAANAERLFCLVNAPAVGDTEKFTSAEIDTCEARLFQQLARCGLSIERDSTPALTTTPRDFNRLFPATGGALYGPASHGWRASFTRPGSRSRIPGLYLAGGSTHPGPGVPMAATSGRLAAACQIEDFASIKR
jgi:1-hydroxycarotenoid 3,4-desaturase